MIALLHLCNADSYAADQLGVMSCNVSLGFQMWKFLVLFPYS